jgi:hypothetical protein
VAKESTLMSNYENGGYRPQSPDLHTTTAKAVVNCLNDNLRLNKRGVKLFFADIDRLFQLMVDHLKQKA